MQDKHSVHNVATKIKTKAFNVFRRVPQPPQPWVHGVPTGAAKGQGPVVVVGAGVAGLSAAQILKDHDFEVVVVEARDRIGGRTNTIQVGDGFGDGFVDEGAAWIDGTPANPLYDMVQAAGLQVKEMNYVDPWRIQIYDAEHNAWLGRTKVLRELIRVESLLNKLYEKTSFADGDEGSLADRIEQLLKTSRGSSQTKRILHFILRSICDINFADPSEQLHPNACALTSDYEGDQSMIMGGYRQLVQLLATGLDIRLGEVIQTIEYDANEVRIISDQTMYTGSHVILTVPLGVLKAKQIDFNPMLPAAKLRAIECIDFGRLEKLILKFETPFWQAKVNKKQNFCYIASKQGDFPIFFDLTDTAGCPMLATLLVGEQATQLVNDPSRSIEQALELLAKLYPQKYQPPSATHTTNWQQDPFTLGSYASIGLQTKAEDFETLAEPVAGRLLFAGEATNREHMGYVDGAMATGIREARRILGHEAELKLPQFVLNIDQC